MSNGPQDTYVPIPTALFPGLVDALAIARNTAMMCSEPQAQKAFEALRLAILERIPGCAKKFDGGKWTEIALEISKGASFEVSIQEMRNWGGDRPCRIVISAAGKEAESLRDMPKEEAESLVDQIRSHLDILAPLR